MFTNPTQISQMLPLVAIVSKSPHCDLDLFTLQNIDSVFSKTDLFFETVGPFVFSYV